MEKKLKKVSADNKGKCGKCVHQSVAESVLWIREPCHFDIKDQHCTITAYAIITTLSSSSLPSLLAIHGHHASVDCVPLCLHHHHWGDRGKGHQGEESQHQDKEKEEDGVLKKEEEKD